MCYYKKNVLLLSLFKLNCHFHLGLSIAWPIMISMAQLNTAVTPLPMHCGYCSPVVSHQYDILHSKAGTKAEHKFILSTHKYIAPTCRLWGVYCSYFGNNRTTQLLTSSSLPHLFGAYNIWTRWQSNHRQYNKYIHWNKITCNEK